MAEIQASAPAAPSPANGVSVTPPSQPAPAAAPVAAPAASPMSTPEPPKSSWFSGFDWMKVLGYTVLVVVGISYIKYTRDKAKKDAQDIADLKTELSTLTTEVDKLQNPPA